MRFSQWTVLVVVLLQVGCQQDSTALAPVDFYRGKVLEIIVPTSPGGGYDRWARMMAPELSKHTGANVIVRNMPGAGGLLSLNYLYNSARKDGLTIGITTAVGPYVNQILDSEAARYDLRHFNWLGRFSYDSWALAVGSTFEGQSLETFKELPVFKLGTMSKYDMYSIRTVLFTEALQIGNVRLVAGYRGKSDVELAIMRNEVHAFCVSVLPALDSFQAGLFIPLVVVNKIRVEEIPDVPTIFEVSDMTEKAQKWLEWELALEKIGRAVISPPGVPRPRVEFLHTSLQKSLESEDFIRSTARRNLYVHYLPGEEIQVMVESVLEMDTQERQELTQMIDRYF